MATKKNEFSKQKVKISIHVDSNGNVLDVAGIPKNAGIVITNVDNMTETFFTSEDNCQ